MTSLGTWRLVMPLSELDHRQSRAIPARPRLEGGPDPCPARDRQEPGEDGGQAVGAVQPASISMSLYAAYTSAK